MLKAGRWLSFKLSSSKQYTVGRKHEDSGDDGRSRKSSSGLQRLGGWLRSFARQQSMAPQSAVNKRRRQNQGSEQFGGYVPKPGDHQFLKAFMSGDLNSLNLCLQMLGTAGKCTWPGRPSKVSIHEWVQHFGEIAKDAEDTGAVVLSASELARAFTCLKQIAARPRLELSGRCFEEEDFETLLAGDLQEGHSQVRIAQALACRLVRGTAAAADPNQVADTTAAQSVLAANDAVTKAAVAVARMDRVKESVHCHRQMSLSAAVPHALEVVLDGVSPAVRLVRATVRNAKHGIYSDVCSDLHLLWSLLALEPVTTMHACLMVESPAAEMLGFLMRRLARGLVGAQMSGEPSNPDMVWALVLTLRICGDLAHVYNVAGSALTVQMDRHVLLGRSHSPGIKEAFARDGKHNEVQVMRPGAAGPECPAKSRDGSPGLVLQVVRERSVVLAMAPLAMMSSDEPGSVSILNAVWELLDMCVLPDAATLRPALRQLAATAGLPTQQQQKKPKKLTLRPRTAEELATQEAGRIRPKVAGYTETRRAFQSLAACLQRAGDGAGKERRRCAALFGAMFIAERAAKEQIGVYGQDKEAEACCQSCNQLFDELRPSFKALVKRAVDKRHAVEKPGSSWRRAQIAGDATREAEIKEMRRSCFLAEEQWFELLAEDSSDDENGSDAGSDAASIMDVTSTIRSEYTMLPKVTDLLQ
eukprot:gb/GFBE01010245.1/.p1 GENE.gb/GFBE01010245.1/~~gb/GFBE01010245.1/.p1  ORF type:complete len:700 (+),score=127.61 gb/GFBE01010245.1/:1-2100(+)